MKKLAILLALFMLMTALCIPTSAESKGVEVTATVGTPSTHQFNSKNTSTAMVTQPLKGEYTSANIASLAVMYDDNNLYIRLHANRRPNGFNLYFFAPFFAYGADFFIFDCYYRYDASTGEWAYAGVTKNTEGDVFWGARDHFEAASVEGRELESGYYVIDITISNATFGTVTSKPDNFNAAQSLFARDFLCMDVLLIGDSGEWYSWNNTSYTDDFYGNVPKSGGDAETKIASRAGLVKFSDQQGDLIPAPEPEPQTPAYADAIATNGDSHGTLAVDDRVVTITANETIGWVANPAGVSGNWMGFKVTAPEGVDATNVTILRPDGETRVLANIKDGENPVFAHLYRDMSKETDRIAEYQIDWDNDGAYDLTVVLDAASVTLTPEPEPEPEPSAPTVDVNGEVSKDVLGSTVYEEPDPVYSAEIAWGAMKFAYTASTGTWSCEEGDNVVSVTNTGNQSLSVSVEYAPAEEYRGIVDGTFGNVSATTLEPAENVEDAEPFDFTLTITGALPADQYTEVVLGTVTVTLAAVVD